MDDDGGGGDEWLAMGKQYGPWICFFLRPFRGAFGLTDSILEYH